MRSWPQNSSVCIAPGNHGNRRADGAMSRAYRQRFAAIERIDFFGSAGRDRVVALLAEIEAASSAVDKKNRRRRRMTAVPGLRGRLWVTRPRPGVDRMASAWLIRRFIDAAARFGFLTDVDAAPANAVPFDMFGAGFGHQGDRCTFEALQARFDIRDAAVTRLATIVHDLDLKDGKFGAPKRRPSAHHRRPSAVLRRR
jgi:hypothetical protein